MTKKDIVTWLESRKDMLISEQYAELHVQEDKIRRDILEPLGFYEVTAQLQKHLMQAWKLWLEWVGKQDHPSVKVNTSNYRSFYRAMEHLLVGGCELPELMEKNDVDISQELFQNLRQEKGKKIENIARTYDRVINMVYSAKNAKEALEYLGKLGFDLSELETSLFSLSEAQTIDTSYLFPDKAA